MLQMQKELSSLQEGMKEFLVNCKIRNLAQDTINYYNESFDYFVKFIDKFYKDLNIRKDIKKKTIDNYIMYMQNEKLKDSTINIKLRGIRSILYFFMGNYYIDKFKISLVKENETIPNLYTDEEIQKLLKKPNLKTCTFAEYRTWAVVNSFVAI